MLNDPTQMTMNPAEYRDIAREIVREELRRIEIPTVESLRPVISQMVQERWVSQSYPVMNSIDLTTRSIETSLTRIHSTISDINATLGSIRTRLDGVEAAINHPEKGLLALRSDVQTLSTRMIALRNTIHGDPEARSGPQSLFERLDAQDHDRNVKHLELMNGYSGLVKRVERVEQYIERRQAWETRIVEMSRKLLAASWAMLKDWRFWLALVGTGAAVAAALLAGQQQPIDFRNLFR